MDISTPRRGEAQADVQALQPPGTEEHPFELATEMAHVGLGRWGGVPGRLLIGAVHGGLDVPANSLAEGGAWLGNFVDPGLLARTRAGVANAERDYREAIGDSIAAKIGDAVGGIATAVLTPELRLMKGLTALPLAVRGAQAGLTYGAEQHSANPEVPLWRDLAINTGLGAGGGLLAHMLGPYIADVIKRVEHEGVYEFIEKTSGLPRVGQTSEQPRRLARHASNGLRDPGSPAKWTPVPGGKLKREIAEHKRIQEITGGQKASKSPALANQRDPIGPKRRRKLGLPEPHD
jgi:hypothetical protein